MSETLEDVRYQFTADFSELRDVAEKAMQVLDKYAAKFKKTDEASKATKSVKSFKDITKSLTSVTSNFRNTNRQVRNLGASVNVLTGGFRLLSHSIGAITAISLGRWLSDATKESIEYIENLNLFNVAMGESVDQGLKFIDTMSEVYGMDPSNLYRYAGYFYELTDAIGMTDEASANISLSLTKASNDIASLFNMPIETVVNNIASGMQGMSRSVRKYGMDIRAVTLQQTALNYGITEQVENMSEADRMALRYLTMMEQVKNATKQVVDESTSASGVMGDFARNIETPANQLRVFKEQVSQLGRAIGSFLIPMLSKLLPIINGVIMALRTVLTFLSALTGFNLSFGGASSGAAKTAKAIGGIGDAAEGASKAAKELKNTLAPFDELNLLQAPSEDTGSSGGSGGGLSGEFLNPELVKAIEKMSLSLDEIEMKANKIRDSLLKFFGFDYVEVFNPDTGEYEKKLQWFASQFETNLINKFPQWQKTITALFDNWTSIIDSFKNVFKSLGDVIDTVKSKVKEFIDSLHLDDLFSEKISNLSTKLDGLATWISEHKDQIADFVLTLGSLFVAFRLFQSVDKFLKPLIALGGRLAPVISSFLDIVAPILAVAASIALLYENSESFASAFQNFLSTIVSSISPAIEAVQTFVSRVWESFQILWTENLQPMVESIGNALAPILDTLSVLWETCSSIFQSIMDMLGNIWENTVAPILISLSNAITDLMILLKNLWEKAIGPILDQILKSLPDLFSSVVQPVIEHIIGIIGNLIEIIMALWNNLLFPLINWLVSTLGPVISTVVNSILTIVIQFFKDVGLIISSLLQMLHGVTEFLVGIFTNDWTRALQGLVTILKGILNVILGVVQLVANAAISLLNGVISVLWYDLQSFVNGMLSIINSVGRFIGLNINLNWGSPPPVIGYVSIPQVGMATGGVVTEPTNALIGEGHYDEAVIPLGNSPQMNDFADNIANKLSNTEQVTLLREQNRLLQKILEKSGDSVGIRDLTKTITRIQKQNAISGGF